MPDFIEIINKFVRAELMILVPVLYIISRIIYKSKIKNEYLALIVSSISVSLCLVYTFSTITMVNMHAVLFAIFTSVTQGVLLAGASIFGGIVMNASEVKKDLAKLFSNNPDEKQPTDSK